MVARTPFMGNGCIDWRCSRNHNVNLRPKYRFSCIPIRVGSLLHPSTTCLEKTIRLGRNASLKHVLDWHWLGCPGESCIFCEVKVATTQRAEAENSGVIQFLNGRNHQ